MPEPTCEQTCKAEWVERNTNLLAWLHDGSLTWEQFQAALIASRDTYNACLEGCLSAPGGGND